MWFLANDCLQTSWGFCPEEEPASRGSTPEAFKLGRSRAGTNRSQFRGPGGLKVGEGPWERCQGWSRGLQVSSHLPMTSLALVSLVS